MTPPPDLSVVICTHNPRPEYLARVLAALRAQTLPSDRWELLLIDNASRSKLADEVDLSWHPRGRHVREDELGLTPARLRGIAEAGAGLLVFVDDDNVLDADYLEQADRVGREHPFLGAWGGALVPEFAEPPPAWSVPYHNWLAIRAVDHDRWALAPMRVNPAIPYGAGICARAVVARGYARLCREDGRRAGLDRAGASLMSGGDIDMALCACDAGLGTGVFARLRLTHIMPPARLDLGYLCKLVEGSVYSEAVLLYIREGVEPPPARSLGGRVLDFLRRRRMSPEQRQIVLAEARARRRARQAVAGGLDRCGSPGRNAGPEGG